MYKPSDLPQESPFSGQFTIFLSVHEILVCSRNYCSSPTVANRHPNGSSGYNRFDRISCVVHTSAEHPIVWVDFSLSTILFKRPELAADTGTAKRMKIDTKGVPFANRCQKPRKSQGFGTDTEFWQLPRNFGL